MIDGAFLPSAPPLRDEFQDLVDSHSQIQEKVNALTRELGVGNVTSNIFRLREIQQELEQITSSYTSEYCGTASAEKVQRVLNSCIFPAQQSIEKAIHSIDLKDQMVQWITSAGVLRAITGLEKKEEEEKKSTIALCREIMGMLSEIDWADAVVELEKIESAIADQEYIRSLSLQDVQTPLIGCKQPLENPILDYTHFSTVRGGGDCYYRAIMLNFLEQVLDLPQQERSVKCLEIVEQLEALEVDRGDFCHFQEMSSEYMLNRVLIDRLKNAAEGKIWHNGEEFRQEVLKNELSIDESLIRASRYLVSSLLIEHADHFFDPTTGQLHAEQERVFFDKNGTPLMKVFQWLGCSNSLQVRDFCQTNILAMGSYAEGFYVNLGLLAHIFNFSLTSVSDGHHSKVGEGIDVAVQLVSDHYRILCKKPKGVNRSAENSYPLLDWKKKGYQVVACSFVALLIALWISSSMKNGLG